MASRGRTDELVFRRRFRGFLTFCLGNSCVGVDKAVALPHAEFEPEADPAANSLGSYGGTGTRRTDERDEFGAEPNDRAVGELAADEGRRMGEGGGRTAPSAIICSFAFGEVGVHIPEEAIRL